MKIAVIGGGISGIAAARVLKHFGHQVTVFEKGTSPGGVWAGAYPEVRLQNIAEQYRLSDFPWPFPPDLHPSREQIRDYLQAAITHFGLDVRTEHEVLAARERADGWALDFRTPRGMLGQVFDFVVVAAGQYSGEKHFPALAERERFGGQVISERDVRDLSTLKKDRIAVVGYGKSAVDMATFAAERGTQVHHVFRAPRWLIPKYIFGLHMAKVLFARMSTAMIPSWVYPTTAERFLHDRLSPVVSGFWKMIERIVQMQFDSQARGADDEGLRRIALLRPDKPLVYEMRSASALAPDSYFKLVAQGQIQPYRGEVAGFYDKGLRLADGREIPCDLVVLSTGSRPPTFPFLPEAYRKLLESEEDGPQLYRHLLHPRIPRLAFAGLNHGFLHVPAVEMAMLWLSALLRGDLELPPVDEMERRIEEIRGWKRENILFEPSRGCAISTRFHQYADVMLGDLGLNPYRKRNPLAELVSGYVAGDYAGILDEYERVRATLRLPRQPLPLST